MDAKDPRLAHESKLEEFRRVAREVAADAPTIAKQAIEKLIHHQAPEILKGSSQSAGRAGRRAGNVSELTVVADLKPGGADRRRRPAAPHLQAHGRQFRWRAESLYASQYAVCFRGE